MKIFHSPKHALRNAKFEINSGVIVAPFEKPARIEYILAELSKRGFHDIEAPKAHDDAVTRQVHRQDYLEFMAGAEANWAKIGNSEEAFPFVWPTPTMRSDVIPRNFEGKLGYYCLSSDTGISPGTWEAACSSRDSAQSAAEFLSETGKPAFALCRPPGHHAATYQYGGYCFINNAAVAAQTLRNLGANRVTILDVDFHHGNGTQEIFYDRQDVQVVNLHGDPLDCFPYFLGHADEKGRDQGEGYNLNLPLPVGTAYDHWKDALNTAIAAIERYAPDAMVVSLGVDTFEHDPISSFLLKSTDFLDYGARLGSMQIPTMLVMEGGYAVEEIGVNTVNVLEGFQSQFR